MEAIKNFFKQHPLIFTGIYTLIYFIGFFYLEQTVEPKYIISCRIDDFIPFCEYFIVPYLMWFFFVPAVLLFLMAKNREAFWHMAKMMFVGNMLCLVIYFLFPNGVPAKNPVPEDNIFCTIVNVLYYTDTPTNVCPSIHVLDTLAAYIALARSSAARHMKKTKIFSFVYLILVCVATVTLKQHSIIDVFAAFALMFFLEKLSYHEKLPETCKESVKVN